MRNYLQPGDVLSLIAPSDVKSGSIVTIGALTGVAAADAAKDGIVEVALTGVFELPKAAAAVAAGDLAFWDGAKVVATGGDGDLLIGAVVAAAGADAATCRVRLNGVTS